LDANKSRLAAWEIKDFQPASEFSPEDPIPVEPGKGWMLVIE
jgi:hypothetical protein